MEEKQLLNINRPLLSVRRFSSIAASQRNEGIKNETMPPTESYKTESKPDPMRNPGSIPFVWEHSPGRPKNQTNKQIQPKVSPPSIPKLPPGRILKHKKNDSDKIHKDMNVKKGPAKKEHDENDDDDDDDSAYMDALDTLSRGESLFYNCSASGLSGLEADKKPSGMFSADPKVRDFMMGRFLPAAKAMASEVPQHAPRKHVVKDKPREVKKLENMDNKKLQVRYGPNFLQDDDDNDEEDDSEFDYNENGNISSKFCGLIPRSCFKGSFGLVNPMPGLSMRTRLPMPPSNRTHARSSSTGSFSETENEPARVAIYEHRSFGRSYVPGQNNLSLQKETDTLDHMVEKTLYVDTIHKIKSPKSLHVSCESLELDTETRKGFWKDPEVDLEVVDNINGDENVKESRGFLMELPTPPPLPKSPSDSWLWRTLPYVSSKRQPMSRNPRYPSSNSVFDDAKSDKSIQLRYTQGPLIPVPEM